MMIKLMTYDENFFNFLTFYHVEYSCDYNELMFWGSNVTKYVGRGRHILLLLSHIKSNLIGTSIQIY